MQLRGLRHGMTVHIGGRFLSPISKIRLILGTHPDLS